MNTWTADPQLMQWVEDTLGKVTRKTRYGVRKAQEIEGIPYTVRDGAWIPQSISWWTNGFWPAEMWQMFLETGDALYRAEAERAEKLMDAALFEFFGLHHDVGFMWLINSGVRYGLDGNEDSLKRVLFGANVLAGRFNPNGFIRAWNGAGREGWSIIDSMMNLPLLYWASEKTGDPRFRLIARRHADTARRCFIRKDGSAHHIVIFDPETGEILDTPGGQGYAPGSSWSRGQAWALYGFMLSHLYTGKQGYLDTARGVAEYFIANMTPDWIPPVDFRAPAEPVVKDNCAGGIAACGLLELADALPGDARADAYRDAAVRLVRAMADTCSDWTQNTPAILTMCTSAYHDLPGRHIAMSYGDYFFIEALRRLKGEKRLFWRPPAPK